MDRRIVSLIYVLGLDCPEETGRYRCVLHRGGQSIAAETRVKDLEAS
jgi:hypothetical protein